MKDNYLRIVISPTGGKWYVGTADDIQPIVGDTLNDALHKFCIEREEYVKDYLTKLGEIRKDDMISYEIY